MYVKFEIIISTNSHSKLIKQTELSKAPVVYSVTNKNKMSPTLSTGNMAPLA
jgi:hypothetical protein